MTEPTKSCLSCINLLEGTAAATAIGKDIGGSVCRALGTPMWMPVKDSSTRGTQIKLEVIASMCPSYSRTFLGAMAPALTTQTTGLSIGKDPEARSKLPHANQDNRIGSCRSCAAYVQSTEVADKTGWTGAGMCSAYGELLPVNRLTGAAAHCFSEKRKLREGYGIVATVADVPISSLFDVQSDVFAHGGTVIDVFLEPSKVEEPSTIEGEDATADEQARGIRTWIKVPNPNNPDMHVLMPVFREDYFPESERAKIPNTGDDEHPELYLDYANITYRVLVCWLALDETPALYGSAGVGKTEFFRHMAWRMRLPFERISITKRSEIDDLAGKMVFVNNETKFQYGRIPLAWQRPCVVVIDEPNAAPEEVWQFLRPLTDNSKQLVLDQNNGVPLSRHNECFMGMAMNPAWDPHNTGIEPMTDADSSRLFHVYVELPPEEVEKQIISDRIELDKWVIDPTHLSELMMVAKDLRNMSEQGSISITWGVRNNLKVARALKWFTPIEAFRLGAADFLDPRERDMILASVSATMKMRAPVAGPTVPVAPSSADKYMRFVPPPGIKMTSSPVPFNVLLLAKEGEQ